SFPLFSPPMSSHPPPSAVQFAFKFPRPSQVMPLMASNADSSRLLYTRSGTRALIQLIRTFVCTVCKEIFSHQRLPYTAYCGHFFCEEHAKMQVNVDEEGRSVKSYGCAGCNRVPAFYHDGGAFELNLLLKEIYEAIETESGYRCIDCKKLNPVHNSVCCLECPPRDDASAYACVWCAVAHHGGHDLRLVDSSDTFSARRREDERVVSLDATHFTALCAFVQCAACARFLRANNMEPVARPGGVSQKACGHMVHGECTQLLKDAYMPWSESEVSCFPYSGVFPSQIVGRSVSPSLDFSCFLSSRQHLQSKQSWRLRPLVPDNFCTKYYHDALPDTRPAKHLDEIFGASPCYFRCVSTCKCVHPKDNGVTGNDGKTTCVWCTLEDRHKVLEAAKLARNMR
ncbi:hypothetical protein PFISCL1PPCAC_13780, partial [Pristionchus fissidentatus]